MAEKRTPNVWVVRANGGRYTAKWVRGGYASIGFGIKTQDALKLDTVDEFESVFREQNPDETSEGRIQTNARQLHRFVVAIRPGDYVITPEAKPSRLRYGRVADQPAYWDAVSDGEDHHHLRRRIEWNRGVLQRSALSVPFQRSLTGWLTVFSAQKHAHEFFAKIGKPDLAPSVGPPPSAQGEPHDAALSRLLAFTPGEFEDFVGVLLSAMGFEKVEVTKRSGDGGIDVIGVLHVSTLAQVQLFVQVKRYQPQNRINKAEVENVRRGIPFGGQGAFITTSDFAKGAVSAATASGFPHIGLINGSQLMDLILDHWTNIPDEFRDRLDLKPGLVPA